MARAMRKRTRETERGREKREPFSPVHTYNAPPSPSIYFFRSRLRRGTCREGKRLSPRAKAKHRKSLKRASASVPRTVVRFRVARPVNSYAREHRGAFSSRDQRSRSQPEAEGVDNVCFQRAMGCARILGHRWTPVGNANTSLKVKKKRDRRERN